MPESPQNRRNPTAPEAVLPKESVCVHTSRIFDSCRDKDYIEDLRVYLTRSCQASLDQATAIKPRSAELLYADLDVEPAPFRRGCYTVDITFYYRILTDAVVGSLRPTTVYGLAVFSKRVMLYGSETQAKIFSSAHGSVMKPGACAKPTAIVEVVDPMVLSARISDGCDAVRQDAPVCLPDEIADCFDEELLLCTDGRRLYVTLGQFSMVRLERGVQLLIPCYDYCIPQKQCPESVAAEDSPQQLFGSIAFPIDAFYPPKEDLSAAATGLPCSCDG